MNKAADIYATLLIIYLLLIKYSFGQLRLLFFTASSNLIFQTVT